MKRKYRLRGTGILPVQKTRRVAPAVCTGTPRRAQGRAMARPYASGRHCRTRSWPGPILGLQRTEMAMPQQAAWHGALDCGSLLPLSTSQQAGGQQKAAASHRTPKALADPAGGAYIASAILRGSISHANIFTVDGRLSLIPLSQRKGAVR